MAASIYNKRKETNPGKLLLYVIYDRSLYKISYAPKHYG